MPEAKTEKKFHLNWPNLCTETRHGVKSLVFFTFLEGNDDHLQTLKELFPHLFIEEQIETMIPASLWLERDKKRFETGISWPLGAVEAICNLGGFAEYLSIPEPLCLEGEDEITVDVLAQLAGQKVGSGMKVNLEGIDYTVAFTDIYSFERYGQPAPQSPDRDDEGVIVLLEYSYFNWEA